MSLQDCIKKAGKALPKADADRILQTAKIKQMTPEKAVRAHLETINGELDVIAEHVTALQGNVAAAQIDAPTAIPVIPEATVELSTAESPELDVAPVVPQPPDSPSAAGAASPKKFWRSVPKTAATRAKKTWRRYISSQNNLSDAAFEQVIQRGSNLKADELETEFHNRQLEKAVKKGFGKQYDKLASEQVTTIDAALKGDTNLLTSLPSDVQDAVLAMRQQIDVNSEKVATIYEDDIADLVEQEKATTKKGEASSALKVKLDLLQTIKNNAGNYVNRSFRAFDDPKWPDKVPQEVKDNADAFLINQYRKTNAELSDETLREMAVSRRREILETGTAYEHLGAFIKESKFAAKDLGVLKKRKEIAPEILALLGEYTDPKINFTKTVTKQSRLIQNHRFLKNFKDIGLKEGWLYKSIPADEKIKVKKLAGLKSKTYEPLNGMYTTPEVEQALKDFSGDLDQGKFMRAAIIANGYVKYGKTVLSPTTAARNLMSGLFFSVSNGHFNLTATRNELKGKTAKERMAFFKKLNKLGVTYDSVHAEEMMQLLSDAELENTLMGSDTFKSIRKLNEWSQRFYRFGDDFWKTIGFINERNQLMKYRKMSINDAEIEAAKRIRDTYPTYSLTPKAVGMLRRNLLMGTFVSFPAEIIRTSKNQLKYLAKDMKEAPRMATYKTIGKIVAGANMVALQSALQSANDLGDEELDAIRWLSAKWNRNSNLAFFGRGADGNINYMDLSFLDPYNYWKRPITAILKQEPWEDKFKEVSREMLAPFFGTDILAQAVWEAGTGVKDSGGPVWRDADDADVKLAKGALHVINTAQPGITAWGMRMAKAFTDQSDVGKKYEVNDELLALFGFRMTTFEPHQSVFYHGIDFNARLSNASQLLTAKVKARGRVNEADIRNAYEKVLQRRAEAFKDMSKTIEAARAINMPEMELQKMLRAVPISKKHIRDLKAGVVSEWRPRNTTLKRAEKTASALFKQKGLAELKQRTAIAKGLRAEKRATIENF